MKRATSAVLFVVLMTVGLLAGACSALNEPVEVPDTGEDLSEVANEGYDLTSYFAAGKAVKGSPELALVYNGARYLFSSEESRNAFLEAPQRYLPGFSSHCPVSLSRGKVVRGKPKIWRIYKDKLYYFADEAAADEFDRRPEGVLEAAEKDPARSGIG